MTETSTSTPLVYILILNYRGTDDTFACLDSLCGLSYNHYRVVVIDNASPDNSLDRLKGRLQTDPGAFHLIASESNLGYSGGNNLGIQYALQQANPDSSGYIWLLNNDTVVTPDSLTALVEESRKTDGLVGSLLRYPDGSYQQIGTRLNWLTGSAKGYAEWEVQDGLCVETLTGASMLIPLRVIHAVGLLDPSFFLYFEDGEYSLRCARKGFLRTVATGSTVFHREGATTGRKSLSTQYYYHRNRLRMLFMFANPLQKLTIGFYAAFRLWRSVVKSLLSAKRERKTGMKVQALAFMDFWKGVDGPCPHDLSRLQ